MPPIYEVTSNSAFGGLSASSLTVSFQTGSSSPLSTGVGSSLLGPGLIKSSVLGEGSSSSASHLGSSDGISSNIAKWASNYLVKKEEQAVSKTKMEEPLVQPIEKKKSLSDYFQKEPCLYTHRVYRHAGLLYQALRHEDDSEEALYARHAQNFNMANNHTERQAIQLPQLEFDDDNERRLTFELAFNTLKYQQVLEEMLTETAFFAQFPEFREEEGIATVMLFDFQARKFQLRTPLNGEILDPDLKDIEKAIVSCKTKLNASLARNRIKANAQSVDHLLPESIRAREELKNSVPIYAWVNQLKRKVTAVIEDLRLEGFRFLDSETRPFEFEGRCFRLDDHCTDTLVFPPDQAEFLKFHTLCERHELIIQDKSSCLAPHVVKTAFTEGTDIMHINVGSGLISAHLASLTRDSDTSVISFGVRDDSHMRQLLDTLDACGATKYVKIMSENFKEVEVDDPRFRNVKSILLTAECSKTGIFDPIDFILTEGEDMSILKDLSTGEFDITKIGELIAKHNQYLKHCMKFTKACNLVYMTRSIKDAENDKVILKVLEYSNHIQMTRKISAYKLQRPILPLFTPNRFGEQPDEDERLDTAMKLPGYSHNNRFIKFDATSNNTGCFIALMVRDGEEIKESAKDILARAARCGLLGPGKAKERKQRLKEEKTANKEEREEHKSISDSVLEKPNRLKSEGGRTKLKGKGRRPKSRPNKPTESFTTPRINKSSAVTNMTPVLKPSKLSSSLARHSNKQLASIHTKQFPMSFNDEDALVGESRKIPEYQKVVHHPGPFSEEEYQSLEDEISWLKESRLNTKSVL